MTTNLYTIAFVDDRLEEIVYFEHYLKDFPDFRVLWKESDALKALMRIEDEPVDVLIIDMQMPKLNGIEFFNALKEKPVIIVCSNHNDYIFDISPYDSGYIKKPGNREKFITALKKAKEQCDNKIKNQQKYYSWITVKTTKNNGKLKKIELENIVYCEVHDKNIFFHMHDNAIIQGITTMELLLEKLPQSNFIRVHKSFLINIYYVEEFSRKCLKLRGKNDPIPVGRAYANNIKSHLQRQ